MKIQDKAEEIVRDAVYDCIKISTWPTRKEVERRIQEYIDGSAALPQDVIVALLDSGDFWQNMEDTLGFTSLAELTQLAYQTALLNAADVEIGYYMDQLKEQEDDWKAVLDAWDDLGVQAGNIRPFEFGLLYNVQRHVGKFVKAVWKYIDASSEEKAEARAELSKVTIASIGLPVSNDTEVWREFADDLDDLFRALDDYIITYGFDRENSDLLKAVRWDELMDLPLPDLTQCENNSQACHVAINSYERLINHLQAYSRLL